MPTYVMRGGYTADDPRLGRVPPENFVHMDKYPLRALPATERPTAVPVFIGINWYSGLYASGLMERLDKFGRTEWWVRDGDIGRLVGGHALVLEPFTGPYRDELGWWSWHDQVREGICVSEASVRGMALYNRKRYQPRPVYDYAQTIDEWAGEDYEGTSMDAGLATLRTRGAVPALRAEAHKVERGAVSRPFVEAEGLTANRWVRDADEVFEVLGRPDAEYAVWLNSWGRSGYPHRVKVPRSVIARLHGEDGEFGVGTDR